MPSAAIPLSLMVLAASISACAAREQRLPDVQISDTTTISEIYLRDTDLGAMLFWRTATLMTACKEIRTEVRAVWDRIGRQEAEKRASARFTMMPEDTTGHSRTFDYVRRDGRWIEWNFFDRDCS